MTSPSYGSLADEAAERFQRMTGLEVLVIRNASEPTWAAKLNLDLLVARRRVVFFDCDWWMLRPFDFNSLPWDRFCAVPDPIAHAPGSFCYRDAKREGWDHTTYFNAGFFACDLGRPDIRRVFADARQRLADCHGNRAPLPADSTDQYHLNWAVQQQPGLFVPQPFRLNCFKFAVDSGYALGYPGDMVGLHAAGVQVPKKLEALQAQAAVFGV